ncbi:MAG: 50S ribosomal protein L18 [Deltaproteobacteria bacterium]|nr:50S ribosomal protein L18 [Deltaproteobacteria bacterium]
MAKTEDRKGRRTLRHQRITKKVQGTPERPRLAVFRSNRHIYAQVVDDQGGRTLVAASTLSKDLKGKVAKIGTVDAAKQVGLLVAEKAKAAKVTKVVFDRGGYAYHGQVKALADAAREAGLEF